MYGVTIRAVVKDIVFKIRELGIACFKHCQHPQSHTWKTLGIFVFPTHKKKSQSRKINLSVIE
jgi:hypothetical protein